PGRRCGLAGAGPDPALPPRDRGADRHLPQPPRELRRPRDRGGVTMRAFALLMLAPIALAACGERAGDEAPTPLEVVSAAPPTSDAVPTAPRVLGADELRRVCRAGLAVIHGQRLTDISVDGVEGEVVNASWRAPVD